VRAAGGQVIVAPMDVMDVGRMAVFLDSGGGAISVWQPKAHRGAQLANEPGSFCWNELDTRDVAAARAFYPAVFGWDVHESGPQGGPNEYYEWQVGGKSIGAMMPMPDLVPAEVPSFWLSYFAVADTDATVARLAELGGSVLMPPADIPAGRFSIVAGPHRETFGVIRL